MADITVTRADVRPLPGAHIERYPANGTVFVGESVYNNGGSAERASAGTAGSAYSMGIVVACPNGGTAAVSGDQVDVVTWGRVTGFSSMTVNDVLYQSDTAGRIADAAGTNSHKIGRSRSATVLFVQPPATEA